MNMLAQLKQGLSEMELNVSESALEKLIAYLVLLAKWNKTYNLTAIRLEKDMVVQHLLDSLAIVPALRAADYSLGGQWADVGSGGGLPGIPLAITHPSIDMTLIDAVEKKSAFQRQVKIELALENVAVVSGRVEVMQGGGCTAVVSRAFADLSDFISLAGHLVATGGRLFAMKGAYPKDEIDRIPASWMVCNCLPLPVPGLNAERHLIVLERS